MSAEQEVKHVWSASLAGSQVCAGYLNCILKRLQLDRPLSEEELEEAEKEAFDSVLDQYDSLHKSVFEKKQA